MASALLESLDKADVRFVRIILCDNANIIRGKAVHRGVFPEYVTHGVGITAAQQGLPVMYDAVVPATGLGPTGEIRLIPDLATLMPLPWAPGHARAIGDLVLDGKPWSLCPRAFLRRMAAECQDAGFEVRAGFETEFFLLRPTPDGQLLPLADTVFAQTLGMDVAREVIDDIADALTAQGMVIELYHPEAGPSQHEISVRYGTVLQAADRQLMIRETIHAIARQHQLRATFLPKVINERAGSGCHVHLSLWNKDRNLVPDANRPHQLSEVATAFMAGVLDHLPALMAVTTPSPNSYRRLLPHYWSGAFRAWGIDNREAALRVPSSPTGAGPTNFELKTVDGSANPYLALGAILAAGLDGVRRRLQLGDPVQVDPGNLTDEERRDRQIDRLPTSLAQAVEHLQQDEVLCGALGSELAQAFIALRLTEHEALKNLELNDEVKLLLERY